MPITHSAKKALRSSLKKQSVNSRKKNQVTKTVKSLKKLVAKGDKKAAQALMPVLQKAIDKAAKTKVIDKNKAARQKSRLSKLVKKL